MTVDEIKQALNSITPGPWRYQKGGFGKNHIVHSEENGDVVCLAKTYEHTENDLIFIANAPYWMWLLIDQLEQVQQENENIVEQNKMMLSAFKDIQHESNDEESVHIASRVIETYQVLGEGGHKDA